MSRTYRRLRRRRGKHNQHFPRPRTVVTWQGEFELFLPARNHYWDAKACMTTPSWWIREMMTRPQRAETRNLLRALHRLHDLEDAPEFPLAKKPHVYFW